MKAFSARTAFLLAAVPIAVLAGCKDPPAAMTDAGTAGATASGDAASNGTATRVKKVDLDACDAGVQAQEIIAKAAKKSCNSRTDCTEWVRAGNCGSVPVAKPFPPTGREAEWNELAAKVGAACPEEPKCKWASMGVECRAGSCAPSMDGMH